MLLSDIGAFWVWFLLAVGCVLRAADKNSREYLRGIGTGFWEILKLLWSVTPYRKEAKPVGQFFMEVLPPLLKSGFENASVHVGLKYARRRIEFRKYFGGANAYGIELRFPSHKWGSTYFPKVRSYCAAHEIPYRIEAEGAEKSGKLLCVDFGQDIESAANLARGIWTEIFSLPEDAPRSYSRQGVSTFGELVDRADQERMTLEEGWRHLYPDVEYQRAVYALAFWVLTRAVVFFGLIISALSSRGAATEWSLQFAEVSFGGSTESLLFLCLYLFNITVGRVISKKLDRAPNPPNPRWLENIYGPFCWIVKITLPIAVVLIWTVP